MNVKAEKIVRKNKGKVVSDKMDKTLVVEVSRLKSHSKYLKKYRSTKRYKVHDERNQYQVGDVVWFVESRPISKDKCWTVLYKDEKDGDDKSEKISKSVGKSE